MTRSSRKSTPAPGGAGDGDRSEERRRPLEAMFDPHSIAVVGASDREASVGQALMSNLSAFGGRVVPVNPGHKRVGGIPAIPRIEDASGTVDLAVICTPAATVPGILRGCAGAGVPAAVVISAGFRETGESGAALERQCLAEIRRSGLRLLGPNCLGLISPHSRVNASFAQGMPKAGDVAFLSQSGALCSSVLDWSLQENVGFSAFVSVGSMLDVGWGDLITHFGDDPHTRSIVCYMESVGDARAFLSAAREVALTKPIVVLKVGRTEAAARAAASHTGALTGSDAVLDAAFRRVGVLRVDTIEELFNLAELLGKQPRPRGPNLAVVTNAGGPGAVAADSLVANGGHLADLWPDTRDALNHLLPPHWSHGNPIDVLGDADAVRYSKAVELAALDPNSDGVLVILTPQSMTDSKGIADAVRSVNRPVGKPILASWMGGALVESGRELLNLSGVPTFDHPDTAARAFAMMWRYADNLKALYETPVIAEEVSPSGMGMPEGRGPDAMALIEGVRKSGRTFLTEPESKRVLEAYGIPTVETHSAFTEEAALEAADRLGFPVAVKLLSETILHKSDVGGVHLDVTSREGVQAVWRAIRSSVASHAGLAHFQGVTVQRMEKSEGFELLLGSSTDNQFGPVMTFGAGGRLVEVLRDHSVGLPPLNATLARRMMERTRIFPALRGVRGIKAVDMPALERLLLRFSRLVCEQRWISEIEINPLLAAGDRLLALDARVVLHPLVVAEADVPRPAIRPYPVQYVKPCRLRSNGIATVRPIRPEDEPLMIAFHRSLSDRSVFLRYFAPLKLDLRIAHERLSRICFIDYDREIVLVVERRDPGTGVSEILGVGRLTKLHGTHEAEFALIVTDAWQGQGLGTQLLTMLVQAGRDERLERITATMLAENTVMQRAAAGLGFKLRHLSGSTLYLAELALGNPTAP